MNETHAGAGSIFTQLRVTNLILVIVCTAPIVVLREVLSALRLLQAFDASRHNSSSLAKLSKAEALIKSEPRHLRCHITVKTTHLPVSLAPSASSLLVSLVVGRSVSHITTHRAHVRLARGALLRLPAVAGSQLLIYFEILSLCCSVAFSSVCPYAFPAGCHTPPAYHL